MFVDHKIMLGTEHVGINGTLTDKALLDCLCNAADAHSSSLGQSIYSSGSSPVSWLLMGWVVEVYARPRALDVITVRTWMQKSTRAVSDRDFEVKDEGGNVIARATSRWMALSLKTGMLTRLTPEILEPYQAETETVSLPGAEFIDAGRFDLPALESKEFTVLRSMIDGNGHVHNTSYMDIALEALPEEVAKANVKRFAVVYKKEIKPGSTVKLEYCRDGEKHYAVMRDLADDKIHSIVSFELE